MRCRSTPVRRVVLLGASNLTRGISTVVATAQRVWGQPLEVLAALGHGRSYGIESRVLGRRLPGILNSGLWEALDRSPASPTAVADYRRGQRHSVWRSGAGDSAMG